MSRRSRTRTTSFAAVLVALLGFACSDEVVVGQRDGAPGGDGGNGGEAGEGGNGGNGGENADVGPVVLPDAALPVPGQCNAYDFRGSVYNCDTLDRCTEQDIGFRLACCECDPQLCNPPPEGCVDPNQPVPDGGGPNPNPNPNPEPAETCMQCHNGAREANNYAGNGMSNPHPFPGAENIRCTQCHGGNPRGAGKDGSHVPPPPSIGNREYQTLNPGAWFNRRTLTGIDKLTPAVYDGPDGTQHSNLDYIQFVNPGDLRVVAAERGCGAAGCHLNQHGQWVPRSMIATSNGIFGGARFTVGVDNRIEENRNPNIDSNTLADSAPRAIANPGYTPNDREIGEVGRLVEQREVAQFNGPMRNNGNYTAANLNNHIINAAEDPQRPNRVRYGSPLEELIDEQVSITCGDCHQFSAGANNRYADFRSSGCTSCHMEYSYDGRSRSTDPNVNKLEPANPDAIQAPERSHIETHQIRNVAKILPNGAFIRGISDRACVGCHQGSNRTVLQYWGIRMDQNADVVNNLQYPANPVNFTDTAADTRLYDPSVANATFNGREATQHLLTEDYDGDNRDDTPPDVHYEAGMGCIDCHGSRDVHGGAENDPTRGKIRSRMSQGTIIRCESCHGGVEQIGGNVKEANTAPCTTYAGQPAECAVDNNGNPVRHVTKDPQGAFWLVSRLTGNRHFVPQIKDITINANKRHPQTQQLLYNAKASYAHGRADGNPQTGTGPTQTNPNLVPNGFSHLDNMDCNSCHNAWVNNCTGCHLKNQYDVNPNNYFFSNITGERILLFQANADFVYQSPVQMYLGVNSHGKITQTAPGMKWWYRYEDLNGDESDVFAFGDRNGEGNNPDANNQLRNAFPALQMNQLTSHAIRGAVTAQYEGTKYCVACHLNTAQIDNFGAEYQAFWDDYRNGNLANFDFDLLAEHIGQNPGNQLNSPFFVHTAVGLGSGLFLFDANGCPVNPLDNNANRQNCNGNAPADIFDLNNVVYDLDRIVQENGVPNAGSANPMINAQGSRLRAGATNAQMSGPLGGPLIQKLANPVTGRILDSWIDADGNAQGDAANYIQ